MVAAKQPRNQININPIKRLFENSQSLKRLLADLALALLERKITPREASSLRSLINQWMKIEESEKLADIELRLEAIEASKVRQP